MLSLFAGCVVAAVALSPSAYADDDLSTPTEPSIVVGGTVHPPATIVVDPETPTAATGPIDPSKPIAVDPRVRPASPLCCAYINDVPIPQWHSNAKPPVLPVDHRAVDANRTAYLDNHGRYWVLNRATLTVEPAGGWPAPQTTDPSNQPQSPHGSAFHSP
jgi:hypothetical protein